MTPVAEATRPNAWLAFRQSVVHFDTAKMNPWLGLRNAIGVALPLFAGVALHSLSSGVVAALGAFYVAFRDSDDPYLPRARHMLLCSVLMGVAVFAGSVSGRNPALAVIVAGGWALVAGMLIALSISASELGVLSLVLLLIYSAVPQDLGHATLSGVYAFAGGLLQTLLSLALWPLHRYRPERRALADLYHELARAAVAPQRQADDAPAATHASIQAQIALGTLDRDRSIESDRFRFLLSQAERMRLALLALRRLRARLLRESSAGSELEILNDFLAVCSRTLASVAIELEDESAAPPASAHELEALVERLDAAAPATNGAVASLFHDLHFQMMALAGQLRAAQDLAISSTPTGAAAFERVESSKPWRLRLNGTLATLRANLNLQSAACRHAIRLAVCIAVADALARGFSLRRSYWLPMTVALVLRSDFAATFSRGVLRLLGTFAGLIFATVLFHALPAAALAPVLAIAALTFIIRWAGPAHYGVAVMGITALVVLLLSLTGAVPREVMAARLLNTTAGGIIALLAYWLWPTWERHQVAEGLAAMLDAFRVYFQAVRDCLLAVPSKIDRDRARVAARLARSNLEASIERASVEPGVSGERLALLSAILASTRRLARALLALEAAIGHDRTAPVPQSFRTFANHTDLTLYYLAALLRGSAITADLLPDLRADHSALLDSEQTGQPHALINTEADRLTNAVDTLSEEVFQWSVPSGPA
jgi:uncharacterized membrane protein YccC